MSWQEPVSFAEAPLEIIDGDRGKNYPKQSEFSESGHCLFLSATNVTKTGFDFTACQFIDQNRDAALNKGKLQREDIVLTTRGTIGNTAYFNDAVPFSHLRINSGMVILRCNRSKLLPAFLYHFVRSPNFFSQVNGLRSGVAQPQLPIRDMRQIKLPLPPLPVQQRIAGILSAYDELIENSQRRIKILEAMARALYREWFVHFRFPGHESHPRVPSPLGDIPEDWEVKRLGEIAEDIRRNVPKGQLGHPQPYVGLEHIPRRSLALDAWETTTELGSNKLKFEKGEILFGKIRPYFHKVSVAPFDGLCSADTIVIRARRPEHYAVVAACVSSDAFVAEASATANGAKMPRANWDVLENYQIVIPAGTAAAKFSALFAGITAQQQALIFQIQNLRRTRDLLLPRLLSGQIDVEALPECPV
jgi:type I restriction enzyme, S subunit